MTVLLPSRPVRRAVALAAAVVALAPALAAAQRTPRPMPRPAPRPAADATIGGISIVPYAGALRMGALVDGPFGTDLRPAIAPMGGAQLTLPLTRELSVVGNVGYGRSDLRVGLPVLGGFDVGTSSAWVYDGGLQLALPTGRTVPFVQAGVGAITERIASGPVALSRTNLAFNAGAGIDVPISGTSAIRLMARDYVGRFDAGNVGDLALRSGVRHNLAFTAGLKFGF